MQNGDIKDHHLSIGRAKQHPNVNPAGNAIRTNDTELGSRWCYRPHLTKKQTIGDTVKILPNLSQVPQIRKHVLMQI